MSDNSNSIEKIDTIESKKESAKYVVLGNVNASKTSFVGVLTKNVLDDGNGYARSLVTKIKHEQETGRTSTHSFHYIIKGNEITTLVDLCGHEKYLKTTMFGVMGLFCDYGIVMIGAERGVCGMTTEHMGLLISNKIPFLTLVGKIDICPPNIMLEVKKDLARIAKRNKKEIIYFEEDEKEVNGTYIKPPHQEIIDSFQERKINIMPVIMTSNKTGYNINFIRELITSIRSQAYLERMHLSVPKNVTEKSGYPSCLFVDNSFNITGIGIVLSGTVKFGPIHLGQKLFIGPVNNNFVPITVKSIHNCISEHVDVLKENESGSIGIRLETKGSYTREMFNKGQIVTSDPDFGLKNTVYSMVCDIFVFNHPTSIQGGFQSVIHMGTVRQSARFIIDNDKVLRTGSRETITIKFTQRPEFVLPGNLLLFRDARCKGIGRVIKTIPFKEDTFEPVTRRKKDRKKRAEKNLKSAINI